jgi:sugar phosphate isomerase/epimerase
MSRALAGDSVAINAYWNQNWRGNMDIFLNVPYRMVEANVGRILSLGIGIEIYIDNNVVEEIVASEVKELANRLQDYDITCTVHAPFMDLSPGGYDRAVRKITVDKLKKSVEMAQILRAKGIVCHGGYDKWRFDSDEQLWFEKSVETWTEVIKGADSGGFLVMVENIFEEHPSTLRALFDYFEDKNLWFCFDSGHFNLFSKIPLDGWLVPLKNRVKEMHLHDNHGTLDEHLPVGAGTFPFRDLKTFLKHTNDLIFTAEVHSEGYIMESTKRLREFLS